MWVEIEMEQSWERHDSTAAAGTSILFLGRSQDRTGTPELTCFAYVCILCRDEMVSERLQTAELQAKLSNSLQEKLAAEGERERLELEVQRLKGQIQWHKEQLSSTKEALSNNQKSELLTTHIECRLSPVERTKDECLDQVSACPSLG